MSKKVRKIVGTAAPLAALIPGVGLPLAVALGAGGGLLAGGGLKGAIAGGLGGAGLSPGIASLGSALGATGAAARGLGAGIAGAGAGGLKGGLKGALIGGTAAGLGGYAGAGGFDGIGESLGMTGEGSVFGTSAGTPLAGGVGPTEGTGILGATTRGLSDVGAALGGGTGGTSSYSNLASIAGGLNSLSANDQAQEDLLKAQEQAMAGYAPYKQTGEASNARLSELLGVGGNSGADGYGSLTTPFNAQELQNDPGYQFQLEQGTNAINRSLGAKGKVFSGEALKAAQDYGTGLADQTYKDAYARDMQNKQQQYGMFAGQSGQGFDVAKNLGGLNQEIGNAKAGAGIASSNIISQSLASILNGSGAKSYRGTDRFGNPIYA